MFFQTYVIPRDYSGADVWHFIHGLAGVSWKDVLGMSFRMVKVSLFTTLFCFIEDKNVKPEIVSVDSKERKKEQRTSTEESS
jgi:hypothetical protein